MAIDRKQPGSLFEYFEQRRLKPPNPLGLWIAGGIAIGTVIAAMTGNVALPVIGGAIAGYVVGSRRLAEKSDDHAER